MSMVAEASVRHGSVAFRAVQQGHTLLALRNVDAAVLWTPDGMPPATYRIGTSFGEVKAKFSPARSSPRVTTDGRPHRPRQLPRRRPQRPPALPGHPPPPAVLIHRQALARPAQPAHRNPPRAPGPGGRRPPRDHQDPDQPAVRPRVQHPPQLPGPHPHRLRERRHRPSRTDPGPHQGRPVRDERRRQDGRRRTRARQPAGRTLAHRRQPGYWDAIEELWAADELTGDDASDENPAKVEAGQHNQESQ